MKRLFYSISMLCALIVTSCSSDEITNSTPTPTPTPSTISPGDVFACGSEGDAFSARAVYWKNNVPVYLTNGTDLSDFAKANDIEIIGNDVYVVGFQSNNGEGVARLWKNGVTQNLENSNSASSTCIDVLVNNNDVYVLGSIGNTQVYWKNGILFNIPQPISNEVFSASKIAMDGTNVAFAGMLTGEAAYMRNGVITSLAPNPNGNGSAIIDFNIVNGDVYYCGQYANQTGSNTGGNALGYGFYGKNNTVNLLNQGSRVTGMEVSGTDVYISGTNGINAAYWKNNQLTSLNGSTIAISWDISLYNGNVYTCGVKEDGNHFFSQNTTLTNFTFNVNGSNSFNNVNAIKVVTN